MKTTRARVLAVSAVAVVAGIAIAAYAYLHTPAPRLAFEGWVEAYFVFVGPDEAGRVETLPVREGDEVKEGAPLFALDADLQRAAVMENEAAVTNAKVTFDRAKELLQRSVGSQKSYDDAEAALRTAQARLNSAKTRLDRRSMSSPATGTVQEIYFRVGELVQPGRPIVSILPPGNTRVRFFVPQEALPKLHIDDKVAVRCDGCADDLVARVSFISAQAEFTPPVIYSQEERARLVFRIEAIPEQPRKLRVGQPVTVVVQPAQSASHASK
jgi:HlyD family secretion protein